MKIGRLGDPDHSFFELNLYIYLFFNEL